MISLAYTPAWFNGKDIIIDLFSILILGLISFYGFMYYRLNRRNKNYIFLAAAFLLMALSFIFKILINFTIYYHVIETKNIGLFTLTYHTVQVSHILFIIGFLLYRVLMLLGLFTLYAIYARPKLATMILMVFLLLVTTYLTTSSYYVFHFTSFLFLLILALHYWKTYRRGRYYSNKLLAWSFGLITLSQIFFVFITLENWFYVGGEFIQLLGYLMLLITFIKVLKDGKKARKK